MKAPFYLLYILNFFLPLKCISAPSENIYARLENKVRFLEKNFQFDSVVNTLEKMSHIAINNNDWPNYVKCLNELGTNYIEGFGLLTKGKQIFDSAFATGISYLDSLDPNLAQSYINLAMFDGSNSKQSLKYMFKALEIRQLVFGEQSEEVAFAYDCLAKCFRLNGQLPTMKEYADKGLNIRLKIFGEQHPKIGYSYNTLSDYYGIISDREMQIEYLEKALEIFKNNKNCGPIPLVLTYTNMGFHYMKKENYEEALSYYKKGRKLVLDSLGHKHRKLFSLDAHIAKVLGELGNPQASIDFFLSTRPLNDKYNTNVPGSFYLHRLARAYELLGNYDEALCYYQLQIDKYKEGANTRDATVYSGTFNMAKILLRTHRYNHALAMYTQALEMGVNRFNTYRHSEIAEIQMGMGQCYFKLGHFVEALKYCQQAVINISACFNNPDYTQNPNNDEEISSPLVYVNVLKTKADLLFEYTEQVPLEKKKRLLIAAVSTYKKALRVNFQELHNSSIINERETLLSNSAPIFQQAFKAIYNLYQLTAEKHYLRECFYLVEKSKSNLLLQNVNENLAREKMHIPKETKELEKRLKFDVDFYKMQLFNAKQNGNIDLAIRFEEYLFDRTRELKALRKKMEDNFPGYKALRQTIKTSRIEEIQEILLNEETTLVEYFEGDKALFAFVIKKSDYQLISIPKEETKKNIDSLLTLINKPPNNNDFLPDAMATYQRLAQKLYNGLLKTSFNDSLISKKLIIIPDGTLNFLPFEVLLTHHSKKPLSYRSLPYLVNQSQISYGYSASFLLSRISTKTTKKNRMCLAMAPGYLEPKYEKVEQGTMHTLRGTSLEKLPGAQKEARILANFFEGDFLFGKKATESNFKKMAKNYNIIHLSMHADANEINPLYSSLYFSSDKEDTEDDTLYSYELNHLNIDADLVVLSACETGKGEIIKGDGVMSLARNFLNAGSKSVIQTLWKIEDQTGYLMMKHFYTTLSKALPIDEALQQSKVNFIQNAYDYNTHPFYWSGYVLNGSTQSLKLKGNTFNYYLLLLFTCLLPILSLCWVAYKR